MIQENIANKAKREARVKAGELLAVNVENEYGDVIETIFLDMNDDNKAMMMLLTGYKVKHGETWLVDRDRV